MENKFALSMTAAFDHQQKQYSTLIRFDDFGAWHYGDIALNFHARNGSRARRWVTRCGQSGMTTTGEAGWYQA